MILSAYSQMRAVAIAVQDNADLVAIKNAVDLMGLRMIVTAN